MPKKGFKVISVHDTIYDEIKELAESKGKPIATFIGDLVEIYKYFSMFISEKGIPQRLIEAKWAWPGPYVQVVTSPRVKRYRSTAWVRSEQYIEKIGTPQMHPKIMERIRDEKGFTIEKVIIVSSDAWNKIAVWKWIFEWFSLSFRYGDKVKVFIVDEKKVPKSNGLNWKYFDMGIYGDELVGFLTLKEGWERTPLEDLPYSWFFDETQIKEAQDAFEQLKGFKVDRSVIFRQFSELLGE